MLGRADTECENDQVTIALSLKVDFFESTSPPGSDSPPRTYLIMLPHGLALTCSIMREWSKTSGGKAKDPAAAHHLSVAAQSIYNVPTPPLTPFPATSLQT